MDVLYVITTALIFSQIVFLLFVVLNFRYALKKFREKRDSYKPLVALIIPCKGIDEEFEKNISSFYAQDFENYLLWFVVSDTGDPAYGRLQELKNRLSGSSKAKDIRILTAGFTQVCSQKIFNLLYCYRLLPADVEIMAFADSDACVHPDWLSHLIYPLRKSRFGAAGGYRWFVAKKNNSASLALSAINAKVVQLLGNTPFNQAWGGSTAIRVETFRTAGIEKKWEKAVSDDLSLTTAIKKQRLLIAYVPACLVATYHQCDWGQLFEFGRRQFLITRVYRPNIWWFSLAGSFYTIAGQWLPLASILLMPSLKSETVHLLSVISITFFVCEFIRAILRQVMAFAILKDDRKKLTVASVFDIIFCWLWTILTFLLIISSAFGNTVRWRGISYKLISPTKTVVKTSDK
jgi:ceramide glucosyltransferase